MLLVGVAVGAVLFLVASVLVAQFGQRDAEIATGQVEQELDATSAQALRASAPVVALCVEASAVGEALRADPRNPCGLARQVIADPVPAVVPRDGRDGAPGPAPTPEQIQEAVAAELARNPPPAGRSPTTAEVAAIVAQFLTDNPPAPGRSPTAAEITAAVVEFFAANPPRDGADGRPPTAEEIRDAVAAELAANPPPPGMQGVQGVQGVGVQDIRAERRDDVGCLLVFVLLDPVDGSTTEQAVPVSDRVCDDGVLFE